MKAKLFSSQKIFLLLCISFLVPFWGFAQLDKCNLEQLDTHNETHLADAEDMVCLAKNSEQKHTLVYTFGIWCKPCIEDFPDVLKFIAKRKLSFYVIIKDKEKSSYTEKAIKYLKQTEEKWREVYGNDFKIKILVLKDSDGRPNKKYKKFISELASNKFNTIDDMSKLILLNKNAEVLMITSYKDKKRLGGKSEVINKLIKPYLN